MSAALQKEQGYSVTGVFIKAWQPEWMACTWREERRDAMKVCLSLNIPFLFFDFEKEYKQAVVDKMLEEYKAGRTPNPDVLCNREIKFGIFWQKVRDGADFIATGHYLSGEKDQSYFLWTLTKDDLAHTLFPVGQMEKTEVRRLAKKFNLPVAEKKDSQGICFIGNVSMEELAGLYSNADFFVLTPVNVGGSFEGFGLVYLEAGLFGKPSIGTRNSGAEDAIEDEVTGLLVEQYNVDATADAMRKLFADQNLRVKLGKASRLKSLNQTWEITTKKYVEIYQAS